LPATFERGIQVAEGPGAEQGVVRPGPGATAFIGRCLRGPVNEPVRLRSFGEFQQVFGGLWQPSPLSYAVEQFFDNGGREAVVLRVVNGGRPATISIPCGPGQSLRLEALSPGSREALRASVDYDNVGAKEDDRFNLVVQRVRAHGSEYIEDQEIFHRVSIREGTSRCVRSALQDSSLVRVVDPLPSQRPDRTFRAGSRHPIGYVDSAPDGDDGEPLSDYDVIGSPERRSGLFALQDADDIDFLCIPPLSRERDVGPSALLVASQFCRDRHLMLVVDPPAKWESCDAALAGLRELEFRSDHALMCFPRILAYDRLRGRYETFANCGAVAGALARLDEQRPLWQPGPDDELLLRPGTRPARVLTEQERMRLAAHGVNPIQSLRSASAAGHPLRTLAGGSGRGSASGLLTWVRRSQSIVRSIEHGTRWAVFQAQDRMTWSRLAQQLEAFLAPIQAAGLFGEAPAEEGCQVICDARVNSDEDLAEGRVNILVSLPTPGPGERQSFLITHSASGSRIRRARARLLPSGIRLKVSPSPAAPQRTVAQELFGRYSEPRPEGSARPLRRDTEAAAPGRRDLDLVTGFHRDFGRRGE
jgi:hypothetical protein